MFSSSRRRLAIATTLSALVGFAPPSAGATVGHSFANEEIARSYLIPLTNPLTKLTLPSVLQVISAHLDSVRPDGSGDRATRGYLYLSLQMTSGPVQRASGSPLDGTFYSELTPLPASALSFVTSTATFPVLRINPVAQANNPSAATSDGLVDATYYFTVPSSVRRGTVVITPSRTTGTPFVNFTGGSPVALNVGGPIRIPVDLPSHLTVTSGKVAHAPTSSPRHLLPTVALVILVVGVVALLTRRRKTVLLPPTPATGPSTPTPTHINTHIHVHPPAAPSTEPTPESVSSTRTPTHISAPIEPYSPAATSSETPENGSSSPVVESEPHLRVKALGALEFDPPVPTLSDPARALLCYLAFHRDRPMTAGEIQTALWPTSKTTRDVSRNTFHNYVAEARKAVGNVILPEAARGIGYQLANISTDVEEFEQLVATSRNENDERSVERRVRALALVREYPFATEVSTYFEWVRSEGLEGQLARSVTDLAYRTALDQSRRGDAAGAEDSLRVGLRVSPTSMLLWETLTDLVVARGEPSLLAAHWTQAESLLSESDVARLRQRADH